LLDNILLFSGPRDLILIHLCTFDTTFRWVLMELDTCLINPCVTPLWESLFEMTGYIYALLALFYLSTVPKEPNNLNTEFPKRYMCITQ